MNLLERFRDSFDKRLISGMGWAFGGRFTRYFAGIVVTALITRLLEPKAVGAYFLAASLVGAAAIVGQMGLTRSVVRFIGESLGGGQEARARAAVVSVLRLGLVGVAVLCAFFNLGGGKYIARNLLNSELLVNILPLVSFWAIFMLFQGLQAECFRGFFDIRLASLFEGEKDNLVISILTAAVLLGIWFTSGHTHLGHIVLIISLFALASNVMAGWLLRAKIRLLEGSGSIHIMKILQLAAPLWLSAIAIFIISQADIWIIGAYCSQEEVAIYAPAAFLVRCITIPLVLVNAVVPSLIAEMTAQGKYRELERNLRATATLASLPAMPILAVFIFFGEPILGILYGEHYCQGAKVLMILSLGRLVSVAVGLCGQCLMMGGQQNLMLITSLVSGAVSICGAFILVDKAGYLGVAIAFTGGVIMQNLLQLLLVRKTMGLWTFIGWPAKEKK